MANPPGILTPDRGKAHSIALVVLFALAALHVLAIGRAVWMTQSGQPAANGSLAYPAPPLPGQPPAVPSQTAPMFMPPPAVPNASTPSLGPPPIPPSSTLSQPLAPPATPPSTSSAIQPAPKPVATPPVLPPASVGATSAPAGTSPVNRAAPGGNPPEVSPTRVEVMQLVEVARQSRQLGDLQGALKALQSADLRLPDDPAVLQEMAQTYQEMGFADKAVAVSKRIKGPVPPPADVPASPETTPDFSAAATSPLSASTGLTTPPAMQADPGKSMRIGPCELIRDAAVTEGEKITLRIPMENLQPGQPINPNDVNIDVFFFDMVNGEKVEQTRADEPVFSWITAPVDWSGGAELLDVIYHMPVMTPDEVKNHGQRKFHGYILKLYRQNKLQDTVADPESLLGFGSGGQNAEPGNPLLPPVVK